MILNYSLKQQTPILHFQPNEKGATLRATEVKPKLDRFIFKLIGDGDSQKGLELAKENNWVIGDGEHPSLDYKMRFLPIGKVKIDNPHKLFFGNIGINEEDKKKKSIFYYDCISISINCFKTELIKKIQEYIWPFFALSAFGTRTSKGFGCFTLTGGDSYKKYSLDELLNFCPFKTFYLIKTDISFSKLFLDNVWVISNLMKSGFNFTMPKTPCNYYKGHIFRYYTNKNTGSDKAFIKQRVLDGKDNSFKSEERTPYNKYVFSRAMLGLADNYCFISGKTTTRKGKVSISSDNIKRFQSPVLYRIVNGSLLIIPQKIPDEMFGATFTFRGDKTCKISTPNDFNIIEFLDDFAKNFKNLHEHDQLDKFIYDGVSKPLKVINNLKIEKKVIRVLQEV